jgi:hypothetical protein
MLTPFLGTIKKSKLLIKVKSLNEKDIAQNNILCIHTCIHIAAMKQQDTSVFVNELLESAFPRHPIRRFLRKNKRNRAKNCV